MDGTLGTVQLFAGNFAPRNWAFCRGQQLDIANNSALFSLLGTIYGGDGETNFRLPDLRGRVIVGAGDQPGLTPRPEGQMGGAERHTLSLDELPSHSHGIVASNVRLSAFGLMAILDVGNERCKRNRGNRAPHQASQVPPFR